MAPDWQQCLFSALFCHLRNLSFISAFYVTEEVKTACCPSHCGDSLCLCVQAQVRSCTNVCAPRVGWAGSSPSPHIWRDALCQDHGFRNQAKWGRAKASVLPFPLAAKKQVLHKHLLPLWKKVTFFSENQTAAWRKIYKTLKNRFVLCTVGSMDVLDICMYCLFGGAVPLRSGRQQDGVEHW